MSLRYLGGYVSPSYNPLAANVGPGVNVAQTQGVYTTQAALESLSAGQWCTDPNFNQTTLLLQADNASNTSQNNTFLDSSVNNLLITRYGNTTQGSFSPFSAQPGYWSNYFDGTLDSITLPTSAALNIGTGSFTIEFWINTNNNNYGVFKLVGTGTTSNGPTVTSTLKFAWWKDGSSEILRSITTAVYGAWYHIAYVRSGTSFKLYVNGVEESTVTNSDSFNFSGWSLGRGYYDNQMFGYLSNFRLTNAAIYTANFSVPNAPLTRTVPSGTVQLLTCQSYNFVDNSINALTLTPVNNVSIPPFSPFAPQYAYSPAIPANSVFFDGTDDYLGLPSSVNLAPGVVFTFEAWIYFPAIVTNFSIYASSTNGEFQVGFNGTSAWGIAARGVSWQLTTTTLPIANQWNHIVACRGGTGANQTSLFLNGTRVANGTVSTAYSGTSTYQIAANGVGGTVWNGYISNLRLVKGVDVYGYTNTTITVPTAPLTAIPNTQLLACEASTFIDSSPNNFTITVNGNSVVRAFSPFSPYFSMGPNVTGGSGSFDGTGDYLTVPGNSVFSIGTGNFTVEAWLYQTATNTYPGVLEIGVHTVNGILFIASNGSTITAYGPGGFMGTATAPPLNTWNHIAWVRSGGTFKIYVNGIGNAGVASSSNISDFSVITFGGESTRANAAYTYSGRISSLRVVPNAAVYTANFTPPTAPLTTTVPSGTVQLLTNFTNAGITDNSLKNVVETVADAKVSTSVKKYGSGSMAFDGTGDWLLLPDSIALQMGLGDFTVEGWVYLTATGTARGLVSKGTATTGWSVNITSTNFLQASYTSTNLTGTIPLVANTWYHFAMVRFSSSVGNIKIYLNGALAASSATAITTDFTQTNPLYVGANRVAGEPMLGYMDDVRITKMARYKDSFIPPTIAFARQ